VGGELEVLVPDSSTPVMSSDGYSRLSMGPRTQKLAAVTTLCVYLVAVSGLSVRLQVNGTLHFGGARTGNNLCDFKQLQKGLRMKHAGGQGSGLGRGVALDLGGTAQGASELGDVRDAGGLFFSAPGKPLPFSSFGTGFRCDARYAAWLENSALYTPDGCQLLTPTRDEFPFADGTKILIAGNSFMFQQITSLTSQYFDRIDHEKSPSMTKYWPSRSDAERCACVGDDLAFATFDKKKQCVETFSRTNWENADGTAATIMRPDDFAQGDGFFAGMTGPPATMGITRFGNGAEVFSVTNHPLMNGDFFGLDAIAAAFELDLSSLDAIYLNQGNYRGFGKLFCGGQIAQDVVKDDVPEMAYAHIAKVLGKRGFTGKLLLTGRESSNDVSELFGDAVKDSAAGHQKWQTILVPFHMQLNKQFGAFVAGDMVETCAGSPTCARKTCDLENLDGCTNGDGHACTPGFPDVGVNMFLHALRADVNQYYGSGW
jgi:hypothetical protein